MAKISKKDEKADKAENEEHEEVDNSSGDEEETGSGDKKAAKKRRRKTEKGYDIYIHKVLKKATEGKTISSKGMEVMNMLILDLEERLSNKAFELAKFQKKSTLAAPHIQTAAKLVFPPEMSGMAILAGGAAVTKFTATS
jgi:histone H3/H4